MIIESGYYDKEFDLEESELEEILEAYKDWCKDNNQEPEINLTCELTSYENQFDHVMYHAEIQVNNNKEKYSSILPIFEDLN
ncbi:hypothetical protein [Poseidonibacter ostreae]|uniref:Uncharacterized protein n=1 Tax=Poseidonibacter ostreae TaxID=2654171 RepID=A0A6L4WX04_9BACT|nr:hypothetical protein [Poseidonibacter ostreae]KAB7891375.1 hypothetical protein GBG19_00635 [Poseidonibacter ostreae]